MRAEGLMHDGVDDQPRDDRPIGIGANRGGRDDLLGDHDDTPGRKRGFLLYTQQSPDLRVAFAVGTLRMDDRHVRLERGHGMELFAGERAPHPSDSRVDVRNLRSDVRTQRHEGQVGRASHEAHDHPEMRVLLDFDLRRLRLYRAAERVQAADARIARPAEHHLADASRSDQLVVDEIRGQTAHRETALPLANDFVPGGKRNEVGEPLERDGLSVGNELPDGRLHGHEFVDRKPVRSQRAPAGAGLAHLKPRKKARSSGVWV